MMNMDELLKTLDNDDCLFRINLKKEVETKLYDYQVYHVQKLVDSLTKNKVALDLSDTGCGKTYCSIAVCKQLDLVPIIICPKSIISNWLKISLLFGIKPLFICNYETLRNGKYYKDGKRVNCPYLVWKKKEKVFEWRKISNRNIIIFDEAHFCKSKSTLNGKLLISTLNYNKLILSATLVDDMKSFEIFTYVLGWCNNLRRTKKYLQSETRNFKSFQYINSKIYPKYGSRISIKELGDKFPQNNIIIETYDSEENSKLIDEEYLRIRDYYKKLEEKNEKKKISNLLVDITYSRQRIELYKIEIIIDLISQYKENKYSIVIFVNFNNTLDMLSKLLETNCVIHGRQTSEERTKNIDDFQSNKERIIICNIQAGGQSINLHDVHGGYPRVSLIVPSYSSTQLVQALGRIHRANSKSPATQRIIFSSGTVEEHIAARLKEKVNNLSSLNDDDLCIFD